MLAWDVMSGAQYASGCALIGASDHLGAMPGTDTGHLRQVGWSLEVAQVLDQLADHLLQPVK